MIRHWYWRWKLKRLLKKDNRDVSVDELYRLIIKLDVLSHYHIAMGMEHTDVFYFPNIETFRLHLVKACELVENQQYTDRLKRDFSKQTLSVDDYLVLANGCSVDIEVGLRSVIELYNQFLELVSTQSSERQVYYRRHFTHIDRELQTLLTFVGQIKN